MCVCCACVHRGGMGMRMRTERLLCSQAIDGYVFRKNESVGLYESYVRLQTSSQ